MAAAIGSASTGYTYDRAGQLISRVDGSSPTSYRYEAYGNQTGAATAFNQATSYGYEYTDRLVSITPPGGDRPDCRPQGHHWYDAGDVIVRAGSTASERLGDLEDPSQVFLTPGERYQVYGIAAFDGILLFLVVDDVKNPSWERLERFEVVDGSLPDDWVANKFDVEPSMVVGPPFLSASLDAYEAFVQFEPPQIDEFWTYVARHPL